MPLIGPNPEDQKKIHAEVNQIANHRFLLTTLAITLFGVVTAIILPRSAPAPGSDIGGLPYAVATAHCVLLFMIFLLQTLLKNTLRIYTSYLIETNASSWEVDWKRFRDGRSYMAYGKPMTIVFAVLMLLATASPFSLIWFYDLKTPSIAGAWTVAVVGLVFEVLILGFGFGGWMDNEKDVADRWRALNT